MPTMGFDSSSVCILSMVCSTCGFLKISSISEVSMTFKVEVPPNLVFTYSSVSTMALSFSKLAKKLVSIQTLLVPQMPTARIIIERITKNFGRSMISVFNLDIAEGFDRFCIFCLYLGIPSR